MWWRFRSRYCLSGAKLGRRRRATSSAIADHHHGAVDADHLHVSRFKEVDNKRAQYDKGTHYK